VTLVIRRPVGVLVGLAAAALLLTACGSGPSQVGSALIVGNTSVSVSQVQKELNDLLASSPTVQQAQKQGKLDQATRGIVTTHVLHDLVARAAVQDKLAVTDQQVDQLISQSGGAAKLAGALEVNPSDVRSVVKDVLLEVSLARKFADTLSVNFGYVVATSRQDATAKAHQLAANPDGLAAMVATENKAAQAQGAQAGGQTQATFSVSSYLQGVEQAQQQAQSQGSQAPTENDGPVFGTPANTVVAFEPEPASSGTWIVALIKSRTVNNGNVPVGASPADNADLTTLEQIGVSLLQPDATSLGVRVSPRYGVWDQVGMEVVPSATQTVGLEIPVQHKP
jgi:hypothetical protein